MRGQADHFLERMRMFSANLLQGRADDVRRSVKDFGGLKLDYDGIWGIRMMARRWGSRRESGKVEM